MWHLNDPDASAEINLERDTIIGFSAIDLSVLMAGFPMVSGWFHIMDLTGKCNGQIKVSSHASKRKFFLIKVSRACVKIY